MKISAGADPVRYNRNNIKKGVFTMLNKIILMGRLTAKPDVIKCDNSDNRYTRFTIAVERNYKSGDEKITDIIECTAWHSPAVLISKFFDKGNMIAVTGELNIDNYTDKDGKNRTSASVHVSDVSFTGERFEPQNEPPKKSNNRYKGYR